MAMVNSLESENVFGIGKYQFGFYSILFNKWHKMDFGLDSCDRIECKISWKDLEIWHIYS